VPTYGKLYSALEACSRGCAIQLHVYFTLFLTIEMLTSSEAGTEAGVDERINSTVGVGKQRSVEAKLMVPVGKLLRFTTTTTSCSRRTSLRSRVSQQQ